MTYYLTKREYEILEILSEGASNKKIAEDLKVSVRTIEAILYKIFGKVRCNTRLELVAKYNSAPENFKLKQPVNNSKIIEIIALYNREGLDVIRISQKLKLTQTYVMSIIDKYKNV